MHKQHLRTRDSLYVQDDKASNGFDRIRKLHNSKTNDTNRLLEQDGKRVDPLEKEWRDRLWISSDNTRENWAHWPCFLVGCIQRLFSNTHEESAQRRWVIAFSMDLWSLQFVFGLALQVSLSGTQEPALCLWGNVNNAILLHWEIKYIPETIEHAFQMFLTAFKFYLCDLLDKLFIFPTLQNCLP